MPTTPIVADAKLCDTEGDLGELESFFSARFNPGIGVGIVQESAPFGCDFVLQGEFETVGVDLPIFCHWLTVRPLSRVG